MPTIFVQKKGSNNIWRTIYKTNDTTFANYLSKALKDARTMSQTAITKGEGSEGLRRALEESISNPIPEKEIKKHMVKYQQILSEGTKDFLIKLPLSYHKKVKNAASQSSETMNDWLVKAVHEKLIQVGMEE
jgi:predicted HicB family RNase H-like nuclease